LPRFRPPRRRKPDVIEREIGALEAELATLQEMIADEQSRDAGWQRLAELTSEQGTIAARLDDLMNEWEENMTAEA
jgi:hypothetical protein